MQLTRFNFYQNLPFLLQKIKDAQYVAFDFEFSGVSASPLLRNSPLDSVLWLIIIDLNEILEN